MPAPPLPAGARRPDPVELGRIVRIGLPSGLHMLVEVAFFWLASVLAARLGALPMAAHQLALSLATLTFTVTVGIGNAGSIASAPSWARATGSRPGGPA